jgi:cytochrome c biogenesis protein CcmG, thiol:disulfide interchange protein DsbE
MSDGKTAKSGKAKNIIAGVIVVAAVFLALAPEGFWRSGNVLPEAERRRGGGDFTLPTLDGGQWTLDEHRGKVVLVNYWATWCPPCRAETPALVRLANEYRRRGLEIVGIALDAEGAEIVRPFVEEYRITYPVLMPPNRANLMMAIEALPTTLLYDRQGRVAKRYVGAASESVFRRDIELLLAEE